MFATSSTLCVRVCVKEGGGGGRPFHINTDHKPLTFALQSKTEQRSPRLAWHLAFIFKFTSDVRHIDGHANHVADALWRNVYALTQAPVKLEAVASA